MSSEIWSEFATRDRNDIYYIHKSYIACQIYVFTKNLISIIKWFFYVKLLDFTIKSAFKTSVLGDSINSI